MTPQPPPPDEINKALFSSLVITLSSSALQYMGKLVNPAVGKPEINLEAAQASIDMLDMLVAKTHGNLDHEEAALLNDSLMSLKLTFVECQAAAPQDAVSPAGTPAPPPPQAPAPNAEEKQPRFRKTY